MCGCVCVCEWACVCGWICRSRRQVFGSLGHIKASARPGKHIRLVLSSVLLTRRLPKIPIFCDNRSISTEEMVCPTESLMNFQSSSQLAPLSIRYGPSSWLDYRSDMSHSAQRPMPSSKTNIDFLLAFVGPSSWLDYRSDMSHSARWPSPNPT